MPYTLLTVPPNFNPYREEPVKPPFQVGILLGLIVCIVLGLLLVAALRKLTPNGIEK